MKKILIALLVVALILGGLFAAAQMGKLPEPLQKSAEKILQQMLPRNGGDLDPVSQYCIEQGGVIQTGEGPDGDIITSCFVNDGKDGIRCQAELFFNKECGHGNPSETVDPEDYPEEIQAFINSDTSSEIDLVLLAPNGESATAFTRSEGDQEILEKVVIQSADGKAGLIEVDEQARPTRFSFDDTLLEYSNYTETTVDISVTLPDGSTEEHPGQSYQVAFAEQTLMNWFIPQAYAGWISDLACTGEDCFYNTFPHLGTALNVTLCGITLGKTLFTAGTTAPLAYMSCASLATRVATHDTEIGPCEGDVLDCAVNSVKDLLQEHGPKSFRDGLSLTGELRNEISGSKIPVASIQGKQERKGKSIRGEAGAGSYSIDLPGFGVSQTSIVAEGFTEEILVSALTNSQAILKSVRTQSDKRYELPYEAYVDLKHDIYLEPDGWISGEIIDSTEGMPVAEAEIKLMDGSSLVDSWTTDGDGDFNLKPTLYDNQQSFTLQVSHADYASWSQELTLTYDIKVNSAEYEIEGWNGIIKLSKGEEGEEDEDQTPSRPLGPQLFNIETNFSRDGITHIASGTLNISLDPGDTGCSINMSGDASGVPQIPAEYQSEVPDGIEMPELNGTFSGSSISCSGSIDSNGDYKLSGTLQGAVSFSIAGQSFDDTDTYPFEIIGTASKAGVSGTLIIDGEARIPFGS